MACSRIEVGGGHGSFERPDDDDEDYDDDDDNNVSSLFLTHLIRNRCLARVKCVLKCAPKYLPSRRASPRI